MTTSPARFFFLFLIILSVASLGSDYANSQEFSIDGLFESEEGELQTDAVGDVQIPELDEDLESSMIDMPVVKLRSLDKISARTKVFEANVGSTVKFGSLYIRVQACRKAPPIEQPESAAFLQVWQLDKEENPVWVFSGWMFASSPGLSSMDHPIYDVWVLDCQERQKVVEAESDEELQEAAP